MQQQYKLFGVCQSFVFANRITAGKCSVNFFHCDKCKKIYFVFKNKFLKKLLVFIIIKSLVYQGVFYGLVYYCIPYTF